MSRARGYWFDLYPDQRDKSEIAATPKPGDDEAMSTACVGFVDGLDVYGDIRSENLPLGAIGRDSVNGGERI